MSPDRRRTDDKVSVEQTRSLYIARPITEGMRRRTYAVFQAKHPALIFRSIPYMTLPRLIAPLLTDLEWARLEMSLRRRRQGVCSGVPYLYHSAGGDNIPAVQKQRPEREGAYKGHWQRCSLLSV